MIPKLLDKMFSYLQMNSFKLLWKLNPFFSELKDYIQTNYASKGQDFFPPLAQ